MFQQDELKKYNGKDFKKLRVFIFYTHLPSGRSDEMTLDNWFTITQDRAKVRDFQFNKVVDMDEIQTGTEPEVTAAPGAVVEDALQCPLCGMVAKTAASLKAHKTKKHG